MSVHFIPVCVQGRKHDKPWASGKSNLVVERWENNALNLLEMSYFNMRVVICLCS